jgi:hypothetical protein
MTPIRVDQLLDLLTSHPNCPLINSMNKGFKFSFWPWAVTHGSDAPTIVDNARL